MRSKTETYNTYIVAGTEVTHQLSAEKNKKKQYHSDFIIQVVVFLEIAMIFILA